MSVIIVDCKADRRSPSEEIRPHDRWRIDAGNVYDDFYRFAANIESDPELGKGDLVALHVNEVKAGRESNMGGRFLGAMAVEVCSRGGRVLFFSGGYMGDVPSDMRQFLDEATARLERSQFSEGVHFGAVNWRDVSTEGVARIERGEEIITKNWQINVLLTELPVETRDTLAALEALAGTRVELSVGLRRKLRRVNIDYLSQRLLVEREPPETERKLLGRLLAWLSEDFADVDLVPADGLYWVAALRRTIRSERREASSYETFERNRDRLSHALFGNDFAQKLGAKNEFLEGYWRALGGSLDDGDKDSKASVEAAFARWGSVYEAFWRFVATRWPVENVGNRKKTLVGLTGVVDELVLKAPELVDGNEEDRREFRNRFHAAIERTRSILRSLRSEGDALEDCVMGRLEVLGE